MQTPSALSTYSSLRRRGYTPSEIFNDTGNAGASAHSLRVKRIARVAIAFSTSDHIIAPAPCPATVASIHRRQRRRSIVAYSVCALFFAAAAIAPAILALYYSGPSVAVPYTIAASSFALFGLFTCSCVNSLLYLINNKQARY